VDGVFAGGFAGSRNRVDYQGTWRLGGASLPQSVTIAAEYERQQFESIGPTAASAQNQTQDNDKGGYGLEYQVRLPSRTALTLSARRDDNQLFDDATTYRITVAQPLGEQLKLRSSYGTGVANPTFFELFGFIPGSFDPNPALKPEKSRGFDVGADLTFNKDGRLSVTYFNTDLQDEITSTFDSATFRSSVANLAGKSKRHGVEVEAQYVASADLTVWVTYTYLDSKQSDGELEVRRPRDAASAAITYAPPTSPGSITLAVDYNGRQQDLDFSGFSAARVNLRDYTLVRLAGTYALTRNWSLFARVENLLDQDYEEVFSYKPSGRAFFGGVQAKF
ncbi:MAG: TonB-dependent receptor, partial [Burkholderiaceae bacterium]|nr:TonB-dependent receptor [Burkholderiaceae bacterium]